MRCNNYIFNLTKSLYWVKIKRTLSVRKKSAKVEDKKKHLLFTERRKSFDGKIFKQDNLVETSKEQNFK